MGKNAEWLPNDLKAALESLDKDCVVAELAGKQTGDICVAAPTGAINELRYAGRNLLDALLANTPYASTQCIDIARRHCQLACYDASDAAIVFLGKQIIDFSAEYPHAHVVESVPSYPSMRADLHEMSAATQEARIRTREASGGGPGAYHSTGMSHVKKLADHLEALEANRDEMAKRNLQWKIREEREIAQLLWSKFAAVLTSYWPFSRTCSCRSKLVA